MQQDVFSISRGLEHALQIKWNPTVLTRHVHPYTWEQSAVAIEEVFACLVKLKPRVPSRVQPCLSAVDDRKSKIGHLR